MSWTIRTVNNRVSWRARVMRAHWSRTLLALIGVGLWCGAGQARLVVTNCDDATAQTEIPPFGAGVARFSLATAVLLDTDIAFDCPAGAVLRVSAPIVLTRPVSIDGGGRVTLDAQGRTQVFRVEGAGLVQLVNLSIVNAVPRVVGAPSPGSGRTAVKRPFTPGSVVETSGALSLVDVQIAHADSPVTALSVDIARSQFRGNSGIVVAAQTLKIDGALFEENQDAQPFANLPSLAPGGTATVKNTVFRKNAAAQWDGTAQIDHCFFDANTTRSPALSGGALQLGGRAVITHARFVGNSASRGGALAFIGGEFEIRRTRFEGNRAMHEGGALLARAPAPPWWGSAYPRTMLHISYSNWVRNRAEEGGAISLGMKASPSAGTLQAAIRTSVFSANEAAASGGAMVGFQGQVRMQRLTMLRNTSQGDGGAVLLGPGMSEVTLTNSLIARNQAGAAGAAFSAVAPVIINATIASNESAGLGVPAAYAMPSTGAARRASIRNSLLSLNRGGNCTAASRVLNEGHNMQFPGRDCGAAVRVQDPLLDTFFVPAPQSPARRAGDLPTCLALPVGGRDIFDDIRPQGTGCTIGAVEGTLERQATRRLMHTDAQLEAPLAALRAFLLKPP